MIQTQIFSQRDGRWANDKMGTSGLKIYSWGCTITSIASLLCWAGYIETPETVNRRLSANGGYYKDTALVLWGVVGRLWPKIKWIKRGYNYNNVEVAWYIYGKKTPVLVEVNGSKIGAYRHWVLFLGDGKMADPWYGTIKATSTYPLTGYSLYSKV